mgnify:CR=1 FL=1
MRFLFDFISPYAYLGWPRARALAAALPAPRVVWVMVPSGPITDETIRELAGVLGPGDLVIDGGNSRFTEDATHAKLLADNGIGFMDAGVSGGVWGLEEGYGLMVGGTVEDVARAMPIFETLRPPGELADGFVHAGPVGAEPSADAAAHHSPSTEPASTEASWSRSARSASPLRWMIFRPNSRAPASARSRPARTRFPATAGRSAAS